HFQCRVVYFSLALFFFSFIKKEKKYDRYCPSFPQNSLLMPKDSQSDSSELQIICLLNPGVFLYQDKTWLLVRVAEGFVQKEGVVVFSVLNASGKIEIIEIPQ
ncbi:hypothetical protein AAGV32_11690, partial [Flavobacterium sp. FZUR7N2.5]